MVSNNNIVQIYQNQQFSLKMTTLNKQTALYLKQFFTNFINQQQHNSTINLVSSSLQVLQQLITNFMGKHEIPHRGGQSINELSLSSSLSSSSIDRIFQVLYVNLVTVFQWVDNAISHNNAEQQQIACLNSLNSTSRSKQNYRNQTTDQQLYQIVSEYKQSNKKLKESLKSIQGKFDIKCKQSMELTIKLDIANKDNNYHKSKIQQLESEIDELQEKVQQLQNMYNFEKDGNQQLKNKLKQLEQRMEVGSTASTQQTEKLKQRIVIQEHRISELTIQNQYLTGKLTSGLQKSKNDIDKRLEQIPAIVENKLKDKQMWNTAAMDSIGKFIKYATKLKQINNLSNMNKQNTENNLPFV